MKKFYMLFIGAAILGSATVSCNKIEPVVPDDPAKEEDVNEGNENQAPAEGTLLLTFSVSQEGDANDESTKTSWDGTTHAWSAGDQIRIIWGEGESDYVDAEVVDGKVSATVADADYYYAVYPTSASYALNLAEGKVSITIPRYQSGRFEDANIMAAKTAKADASFAFKNMTSILKFTTGNTYSYNSASFMVNDKSIKLTGEVHTTFPAEFAVTTTNETMKQDIICIQPGNPTGNAGMVAGTTYYLAMMPGAAVANGIGFKIEQRDAHTTLVAGGISKSSFNRERAKVYDLGTLDNRIVSDWYISESGTGNGATQGAPAGPAKLMELLNPSYSSQNTTAGWRLVNATIHVAGGTYNLQALNGGEVFDPHYNLSGLVAHIKGEGTPSNPTRFVCNEADGDHIFALTGTNRVGNYTFENITFAATNSLASDGIAFCLTSTGKTSDEHNVITFKDCTFTGLVSTVSSGNGYGGSAVNIYDNADYDVVFDGCTFSDNTAVRGGAVALTNGGENSNVSFTGCTFSNNIASSNQGGAVYVYATGKTTFDSTSFSGDGSTSTAANGGALAIIAGATVTLQNGCSFTNCVSSGNGGAIFNHGTLNVIGSSFTGNLANQGGAIYTDGTVNISAASTFSGNDTPKGSNHNGGAIFNNGALTVDGSTIAGKGKDTDLSTLLGGGIYNSTNGNAILQNGAIVEECAITGSNHHGAGIYNKGTVTIENSIIRNNKNTQRGAGLYSAGGSVTVSGSTFSGNEAANGGAGHFDDGANVYILNSTISGNTATNGSALRTANNNSGTDVNKLVVFNSLIEGNVSGTGTNAQNNATVQATGYGTLIFANCTIRNNTTPGSTSALTVNGSNSKVYAVSCTMAENGADITRTNGVLEVHNSILMDGGDNILNVIREKSIWKGWYYGESSSSKSETSYDFALGTYSNGVYPLNSTYEAVYTQGMSVAELQAMAFNNVTLTQDQLALLAKDQKGNNRTGTIMGAYVLTQ